MSASTSEAFMRHLAVICAASFAVVCPGLAPAARADEPPTIDVTLKDHRFTPSDIQVPTGKRVVLRVHNADATPEEFDSSALQVEKVIAPGGTALIRLHPLGPGRFPFMGEFNPSTAQGVVISE
jgi:hypothetical protein